jgi:hypothetical protein
MTGCGQAQNKLYDLTAAKDQSRLQGFELIQKVITGVRFVDGEEQTQQAA